MGLVWLNRHPTSQPERRIESEYCFAPEDCLAGILRCRLLDPAMHGNPGNSLRSCLRPRASCPARSTSSRTLIDPSRKTAFATDWRLRGLLPTRSLDSRSCWRCWLQLPGPTGTVLPVIGLRNVEHTVDVGSVYPSVLGDQVCRGYEYVHCHVGQFVRRERQRLQRYHVQIFRTQFRIRRLIR